MIYHSDQITMDEFLGATSGDNKTHHSQYKPSNPTKSTATVGTVRKPRNGCNNPFFNHKHSDETKAKMRQTQKARYDLMRGLIKKEGKDVYSNLRKIIAEEIERYLSDAITK